MSEYTCVHNFILYFLSGLKHPEWWLTTYISRAPLSWHIKLAIIIRLLFTTPHWFFRPYVIMYYGDCWYGQLTTRWNDRHRLMSMVKSHWLVQHSSSQLPRGQGRTPTSFLWQRISFSDHRMHCLSHHITSGNSLLHLIKWNLPIFLKIKGRFRLWECRVSLRTLLFHGGRILRTGEKGSWDTWKFTNLGEVSVSKPGSGFGRVPMTLGM